jgi:hypothetical protein
MNTKMNYKIEGFRPLSIFTYLISIVIVCLSLYTLTKYSGNGYIYVLFTIISTVLLYFGFRKNAIFFDTFIGVFFWLGFWLKLTVRVAFMDGGFYEAVGNFNGSAAAFDRALLVTSCAFFGLIVASISRERFLFSYPQKIITDNQQGLLAFYRNNRMIILISFIILIVTVAVTNAYFVIYQRGTIPETILPYGLSGVYKWLLMFGLATLSAIILKFEMELTHKPSYLAVILSFMESLLSNISLLSRGMILNVGSLMYGMIRSMKLHKMEVKIRFLLISMMVFVILFASSVFAVNYVRASSFHDKPELLNDNSRLLRNASHSTALLFLDRWVGIEGVMAISSYPEQGWGLWEKAWKESYTENDTSFYDNNIITSPYIKTDKSEHHFISLPGIVAFCFYPGSFIFLFSSMFLVGMLGSAIEVATFKLGGKNIILCSLLAQVVAFRLASFGYVPAQSYLLFGSIFLNLIIIFTADKFLVYCSTRKNIMHHR